MSGTAHIMVKDDKLLAVLGEFACALAIDFSVQSILDHLASSVASLLPDSPTGVTLFAPERTAIALAGSDATALRYEQLQATFGDGPGYAACKADSAVSVFDLQGEVTFPWFGPVVSEEGLASIVSVPLTADGVCLGVLNIYRSTASVLPEDELLTIVTIAGIASTYVCGAQLLAAERATSDRIRYEALHDPLTGLPNRALLQQRLEHAALRASRSNTNAAILFADLDRFKEVNDTYGHQVGDELLLAVAHRLARLVRPGDTLARVSGDEFVFLCEDMADAADVEVLAQRIRDAFINPFSLSKIELNISASVGMAFAGPGEEISHHLVIEADIAMYQAKRRHDPDSHIIDVRAFVSGGNS